MKTLIFLIFCFPQFSLAAEDISKCNIDAQGDPNNKPECYKNVPAALKADLELGGWPKGTKLKKLPKDSSPTIEALVDSGHWTDEKIKLTGKIKGEWAEVKLIKFKSKLESCDDTPEVKWTKKGWIKALDNRGKPIIWQWLYSGLC